MSTELVVNLHVTERCNYSCSFCFGKWRLEPQQREVFRDLSIGSALISELSSFFNRSDLGKSGVRFNFVGGEPALLNSISGLVERCRLIGDRVSYVTNGLMLVRFDVAWTARFINVLGLSVDSTSAQVNVDIGRLTKSGRLLNLDYVTDYILKLRSAAPDVQVKVNTVVSRYNYREDLTQFIDRILPDRWKIMQVLPVYSTSESVTDGQFKEFIDRHRRYSEIIVSEDNQQMTSSYIMVDPLGRFFWRTDESEVGYQFSSRILDVGADAAFAQCLIVWPKYQSRYSN